jgi:hypothetical protein
MRPENGFFSEGFILSLNGTVSEKNVTAVAALIK